MLTSLAGNMTLASLNITYSPPGMARSSLWSFGAASPVDAMDICDDFQSNAPLKASHGISPPDGPTGLGIIYPASIQKEQRDSCPARPYDSGPGHNMIYKQHTFMHSDTICYDPHFGSDPSLPGEAMTEILPSSLLYPTELPTQILDLMNEGPVIETAVESSVPAADSHQPPHSVPSDVQGKWVLQRLLEITGLTIESLSPEIQAGFQDHKCTGVASNDASVEFQSNAAYPQNAFLRLRDSPVFGINPADILPPLSDAEIPPLPPLETPGLVPWDSRDVETEISNTIPESAPEIPQGSIRNSFPLTAENLRFLEMATPHKQESDYEPSLPASVSSSNESVFEPSLPKRKLRPRIKKVTERVVNHVLAAVSPAPVMEESMFSILPINYGTPVLDAHRGIELRELKAKAERYRLRNQGRDYDKKWLLSFAGKLTPQGLLTEEYRCYINGCNQFNRRRDHILIHVGGHLDQRPFACSHCSARFLRKNECKRHELSHTGTRPFTCDLCPSGVSAFVRQDLLKRHQKRTHSLDNTRSRILKRQSRI